MALRLSCFAIVIPGLLFACGEDHGAPAGPGGSSNQAASPGAVVAGSGGTTNPSRPGAPSGGTSVGTGGVAGKASGGSGEGPESGGTNAGSPIGGTRNTPAGDAGSSSSGVIGNGGAGGVGTGGVGPAGTAGEKASGGSSAPSGSGGGAAPSGGGTGGADTPMTWAPTFQTVKYMFEEVPCYGSNCHNSPRNHFQVQKSDDELYRYMMSFTTLECGKLIDKANPPNSALVKYLKGPCGSIERMPPGWCVNEGDPWCLPEELIQAVEDWIAAGAPR